MPQSSEATINSLLLRLRESCRQLAAHGDLEAISGRFARGETTAALEDCLGKIDVLAERVREVVTERTARDPFPIVEASPELWRFYEDQFLPVAKQLSSLYYRSLFAAIDPSLAEEVESAGSSVAQDDDDLIMFGEQVDRAFRIGIDLVDMKFDDNVDEWELCEAVVNRALLIQSARFFSPGHWSQNLDELRPVVTGRPARHCPVNVRVRLIEIWHSFIFGNWLAVLALCRSVLEYVLVERAHLCSVEAYEMCNGGKRPRRLGDLIDEYSGQLPEIQSAMETIKNHGNYVMHPSKDRDIVKFPKALRKTALESIEAMRTVLAVVYRRS